MVGAVAMLPRARLIHHHRYSHHLHHHHPTRSFHLGACWQRRPLRSLPCSIEKKDPLSTSLLPLHHPLLLVPRCSSFPVAEHINRLITTVSCAEVHVTKRRRIYLQEGILVEFKKDSGKISLGVTQSREGKKNWNVLDQNAETCIVRPKQITVVVPGGENFTLEAVNELLRQVDLLQDPTCLEVAWEKMSMSNKNFDLEELALVLYGSSTPDKCYGAYRLLTSYPIYFECKDNGYCPMYEARSVKQVRQLQLQELEEEVKHKHLLDFVALIKSAMKLPYEEKPKHSSWESKTEFKALLESLRAIALETVPSSEGKTSGMQVLNALGVSESSGGAKDVMIQMGYFRRHENFDLLKLDLPIHFSNEVLNIVKAIKVNQPDDLDKDKRTDLTSLKVFTIDTACPKEIDDGLSAIKLPDGRFKVWIHVADPTRWFAWDSTLRKEASRRGTSLYLPTTTIPMFPMELAWDFMSLRQGHCHPAISVSAILSDDGSIAEAHVESSIIHTTYNLSYEAATELLSLNTTEETELSTLYEAATLRNKWRLSNGASNVFVPKPRVCVEGEDTSDPEISVSIEDETSPSAVIVTEMMIMCGEVIAQFGGERGLPLPYRCQAPNEEISKEVHLIPEGLARSLALLRSSSPVDMNFVKPLQHASLGLAGYVQFTSPIRRYPDLLAHFQIKAVLKGKDPPLLAGYLEASMVSINDACRRAKKLQLDTERYWILEYLRRQPSQRKFHACIIRFVKNRVALVFLTEVGFQAPLDLRNKRRLGDEFFVQVRDVQPRKNFLQLSEC